MSVLLECYNGMIEDLDKEHENWLSSLNMAEGNQAAVFAEVGERMVKEKEYQDKREQLVRLRDSHNPFAPGVEEFLNPKKEYSKFDVDSGEVEIDNSLTPLGGKKF